VAVAFGLRRAEPVVALFGHGVAISAPPVISKTLIDLDLYRTIWARS
jgi:hypothetical protein